MTATIELRPVDARDWRACADLEVAAEQRDFVSPATDRGFSTTSVFGYTFNPLRT